MDIACLTTAQAQLKTVRAADLGVTIEVDDVGMFMPLAPKRDGDAWGPGKWLYAPSEVWRTLRALVTSGVGLAELASP